VSFFQKNTLKFTPTFLLTLSENGGIIKQNPLLTGEDCQMIYQKIFTVEKPYHISVGHLLEFPEHRHADFELNFCLDGEFDIVIDRQTYHVNKGFVTFIPSMCSHAIPAQSNERSAATLIVGSAFLKRHFNEFSRLITEPLILDLNLPEREKIKDMFLECVEALRMGEEVEELLVIGNVYKILYLIRKNLSCESESDAKESDYRKIENVESALDLIYYNYKEPITVEYAASLTGYSKSNFCKIFKKVVGESFHQVLNRQRVNNAAGFLKMSNMSVTEIASEVGFSDAKAFCRVFKDVYGMTPGEYRKSNKA